MVLSTNQVFSIQLIFNTVLQNMMGKLCFIMTFKEVLTVYDENCYRFTGEILVQSQPDQNQSLNLVVVTSGFKTNVFFVYWVTFVMMGVGW